MPNYEEIRTTEFTPKESGLVEVRTTTRIFKDGQAFGEPSHHRCTLNPYSSLGSVPLAPGVVGPLPDDAQAAILVWWTPARVAKYDAAVAALASESAPPPEKSLLDTLTFGLLK